MKSSKMKRLLAHIIVPVILCIIGYLVLFLVFKPYVETAAAAVSVFRAGNPGEIKARIQTIYDPNAPKAEVRTNPDPYIHAEDVDYPTSTDQYGRLTCEKIGLNAPVYWDDTNDILRKGVGQYMGTFPPGFGRMILLSGHNTTHFKPLKDIKVGDVVQFDTNYCEYEYEVDRVDVLNEKVLENWILDHLLDEEEVLVMYTCYPFEFQAGRKTDRLTVFAHRISGYDVEWRNIDEIE